MLSLPPLLLALTGQLGAVLGANLAGTVATAITGWADGVFTDQTMSQIIRPLLIGAEFNTAIDERPRGFLSYAIPDLIERTSPWPA